MTFSHQSFCHLMEMGSLANSSISVINENISKHSFSIYKNISTFDLWTKINSYAYFYFIYLFLRFLCAVCSIFWVAWHSYDHLSPTNLRLIFYTSMSLIEFFLPVI